MRTAQRTPFVYRLTCPHCQRTWDATYDVLAYHDADGDHELFFHHGVPATPPWARSSCPACGDQRVAVVQRTTRPHRR